MNLIRKIKTRFIDQRKDPVQRYFKGGRLPFSPGYGAYRWQVIKQTINDPAMMEKFRQHRALPQNYGKFLDERVVEYPWLLSRLEFEPGQVLLDAGSALNNQIILDHEALKHYKITIMTLAPEARSYWERGISYVFGDLRDLLFKDNYFDVIVSISTLEHIGMDNTLIYTGDETFREYIRDDYLRAVTEFKRVLKPGGKCYLTMPFGQYQYDVFQQQFDAQMIEKVKTTFQPTKCNEYYYKYHDNGWNISTLEDCMDCKYFNVRTTKYFDKNSALDFDPDKAAAARAIAALELIK